MKSSPQSIWDFISNPISRSTSPLDHSLVQAFRKGFCVCSEDLDFFCVAFELDVVIPYLARTELSKWSDHDIRALLRLMDKLQMGFRKNGCDFSALEVAELQASVAEVLRKKSAGSEAPSDEPENSESADREFERLEY